MTRELYFIRQASESEGGCAPVPRLLLIANRYRTCVQSQGKGPYEAVSDCNRYAPALSTVSMLAYTYVWKATK